MTTPTSPTAEERRKNRSTVPAQAVRRLLDTLAARHGIDTIVLVGERRLMAHNSTPGCDVGRLAWIGIMCARGMALSDTNVEELVGDRDVYAHRVALDGEAFYLTSVGGRVPRVHELRDALARILPPARRAGIPS